MKHKNYRAMTIGGSAGAVEALLNLLPHLKAGLSFPIFIVLHQLKDGPHLLPKLFSAVCELPVVEAEPLIKPEAGKIYLAPADYHLTIEDDGSFSLSNDEPVHYSRPSIDVLFDSVASYYQSGAMGILLTGANSDGAEGLHNIAIKGGYTIVEGPASAKFTDMPQSAIKLFQPNEIISLAKLGTLFEGLK